MADGTNLPDLRRRGLVPAPDDLVRAVGDAALAMAWRALRPGERDAFVRADTAPVSRLRYQSDDGWAADLFHLPPLPGAAGEPVLLGHGLGATHRDFVLDPRGGLARYLRDQGHAVYIWEHRGDPSSIPPPDAGPFSVDDIATRDLPAAIDRVLGHSGYSRVLVAAHGLAAQAVLIARALGAEDRLAAAALLGPAVLFSAPASATRLASVVAALLPASWTLPARRVQQLATPWITDGADLGSPGTAGSLARGRLRHGGADLAGGVVKQVARWVAEGALTDATGRLDIVTAQRPLPALVVTGNDDPACPPGAADPLVARLRAKHLALGAGWGHLDCLLGGQAPEVVFAPVSRFFLDHRRRCR